MRKRHPLLDQVYMAGGAIKTKSAFEGGIHMAFKLVVGRSRYAAEKKIKLVYSFFSCSIPGTIKERSIPWTKRKPIDLMSFISVT